MASEKCEPYRALVFSPNFAPYTSAEALVNNKFVLALIEQGWSVDVISLQHLKRGGIKSSDQEWHEPWKRLKNLTHRIPLPGFSPPESPKPLQKLRYRIERFLYLSIWTVRSILLSFELHRIAPFHLVISRSFPFASQVPACIFSKVTGIPWIANWNDPVGVKVLLSETHGVSKKYEKSNRLLRFFVRIVSSSASWHTFPSDRLRRLFLEVYGNRLFSKSTTVPHVALRLPIEAKEVRTKSCLVLCHAGNFFSDGRDSEVFFKGLRLFLNRFDCLPPVRFVLIGNRQKSLNQLLIQYGLGQVVSCEGPFGYLETIRYTAGCDVLVVLEGSYPEGYFLPSKFVDYVQTGKPILAVSPKDGTLSDIIHEHGGGMVADCTSPESIADAIYIVFQNWRKGFLSEYGSKDIFPLFDNGIVAGIYNDLLKKLAEPRQLKPSFHP